MEELVDTALWRQNEGIWDVQFGEKKIEGRHAFTIGRAAKGKYLVRNIFHCHSGSIKGIYLKTLELSDWDGIVVYAFYKISNRIFTVGI